MRDVHMCKNLITTILLFFFAFVFIGCASVEEDTKVVLTTGFAKDELFRIDEVSCTVSQMMVYLTNMQNQYENVYGEKIWETRVEGVSLEANVKDNALSKIAQVKTIALLAKNRGIVLTDEEVNMVKAASEKYYSSLNSHEIEAMGITEEIITNMYTEYALATKVYQDMIKDVNPEISDDEARTITVLQVFFSKYEYDDNGERVKLDDASCEELKRNAMQISLRAKDGEDFEKLAVQYGFLDDITMSFGEGEVDFAIESVGFGLGKDEVSDVIETNEGYIVLKCISTFNRDETEENKKKIVERRKREAFSKEYEDFVQNLTKALNQDAWEQIEFIRYDDITTSDFFEIFEQIFVLE